MWWWNACPVYCWCLPLQAFRQKLQLKSVEYKAVDNADWSQQLTASSRAEISDMDLQMWHAGLTRMNRNSWRKIGLADANLVICSYVHDVLRSMLIGDNFLTQIVANGACLLYVCPNG